MIVISIPEYILIGEGPNKLGKLLKMKRDFASRSVGLAYNLQPSQVKPISCLRARL